MKSLRNFSASSDTLSEKLLSLKGRLSTLSQDGLSGMIILVGVLGWGWAICGIKGCWGAGLWAGGVWNTGLLGTISPCGVAGCTIHCTGGGFCACTSSCA